MDVARHVQTDEVPSMHERIFIVDGGELMQRDNYSGGTGTTAFEYLAMHVIDDVVNRLVPRCYVFT